MGRQQEAMISLEYGKDSFVAMLQRSAAAFVYFILSDLRLERWQDRESGVEQTIGMQSELVRDRRRKRYRWQYPALTRRLELRRTEYAPKKCVPWDASLESTTLQVIQVVGRSR